MSADHFDEKDRTEPTDAHIRYSKKKQKYVLVKQVSGNQIDENRLLSYVEETLDKDFETELLTSDVKMELNEEVYRQPDIEESGEMKQKVKKLNSLLKNTAVQQFLICLARKRRCWIQTRLVPGCRLKIVV